MNGPSSTFCIRPWTSFQITANGRAKVCCWTHQFVSSGRRPLSLYEHSLEELWNSAYMRELRRAMLAGHRLRECEYCYREEAGGGTSPRIRSNGEWFADPAGRTPEQVASEAAASAHVVAQLPRLLHLDFGNACNLACRMCGGDSSSRIETDPVHGKWAPRNRTADLVHIRTGAANRFPTTRYWYQQQEFIEGELLRDAPGIQALYLIGGEPFLIKEVGGLLDALIQRNLCDTVGLNFSTNATLLPEDFLERLARFAHLFISLSLDGAGAAYEYIRYPAQWEQVSANVDALRKRLPRARLLVTPTLQAYNALSLADLLRFCDGSALEYQVFPLVEPDYLSLQVLPPAVRALGAERMRDYARQCPQRSRSEVLAAAVRLESPATAFRAELLPQFMLFTNDLDACRGQSFEGSLPDLHAALESSGVRWRGETVYARGGRGHLPASVWGRSLIRHVRARLSPRRP
ncbi:MAG TPA: twitch domain-containing radical SAM protein [Bryobacteraceae bacterium]|nr:twitch domain-containing radical SAM protein [Bryobacteraceae bacterium]